MATKTPASSNRTKWLLVLVCSKISQREVLTEVRNRIHESRLGVGRWRVHNHLLFPTYGGHLPRWVSFQNCQFRKLQSYRQRRGVIPRIANCSRPEQQRANILSHPV